MLLGDEGVAAGARPGLLCVDMSTIGRSWARRIGARLAERDVRFMDAPVTGSSPKAQDGTLTIMAGGEPADFERARPLFEAMGELVVHVGPLGDGQMVKLINNAVAATNAAVVGEALLLGRRSGVDLDALLKVMGAGAGGSAMLALKARPMIDGDYTTLFKLEHMLKDVRLCLEEASESGAPPPTFFTDVEQILAEAGGQGHGQEDFASLVEALAERRAPDSEIFCRCRLPTADWLLPLGRPRIGERAASRAPHQIHDHRGEQDRQHDAGGCAPQRVCDQRPRRAIRRCRPASSGRGSSGPCPGSASRARAPTKRPPTAISDHAGDEAHGVSFSARAAPLAPGERSSPSGMRPSRPT